MGYFRAMFGPRSYYEYRVGVGPEEAVRRAVAFWRGKGCEVEENDIGRRLREAGYTGTEMSGGSDAGFLKDLLLLVSVVGWALLFIPATRRAVPRPFTIGIAASLEGSEANGTTLFCFDANEDNSDSLFSPREYTEHQMIKLGRKLARQGILREAPRRLTRRDLSKDHPLRDYDIFKLLRR